MAQKITSNSKDVSAGDIFVAVRGYNVDGHLFIDEAIRKGARAIVAEKSFKAPEDVERILVKDTHAVMPLMADIFYNHPSRKLKIVGITGTNGKTTVAYLVENILKAAGKASAVIGTINYRIKGREIAATNTTPGALELQAFLNEAVKRKVRHVIMEVSSHSLDQGRVDCTLFDVAIFTNITKEHLDYHKTMKNYFAVKAKLFEKLKKDGAAVLNNDDKLVKSLKKRIKNRVLTYGATNRSDITASELNLSIDSSSFVIKTPKGSVKVKTPLIGTHNVSNILAAVAAAISLGIPLKVIKKGIESFSFVPGRLETVDSGQPFKVFVDYAHTEDALRNILSLLKEVIKDGRIITVFGCGGDRDRTKRPLMGRTACRFSDKVIVTSDNPRFEDPKNIISQIEKGIKGRFSNYNIIKNRACAIAKALRLASAGDVVVIAGKGHEKYQIIGAKKKPFDDCEVARSMLKEISC